MFEELLKRIACMLDELEIDYMVIGGQAVLLHGEPRLTRDIDITLGVDRSQLQRILDCAIKWGFKSVIENAEDFVRRTNVLLLEDETRQRLDLIFSFSQYEAEALNRAVVQEVGGYPVRFISAEDLILHKLVAGRPRDLDDIRGILIRKQGLLDLDYLRRWARLLAEAADMPELLKTLENKLGRYYHPS
jgi:predicted nucleotidyltransferase